MSIVTTMAPIALALIMLGLGASLTFKDFTRVLKILVAILSSFFKSEIKFRFFNWSFDNSLYQICVIIKFYEPIKFYNNRH